MNYIRVETMNTHTEETLGGYICAAHSILSVKLGVPPTTSDEELARIINESDDPEVQDVFSTIMVLSDIPQPEIYIRDKRNKICLYQQSEFDASKDGFGPVAYDLDQLLENLQSVYKSGFLLQGEYEKRMKQFYLYRDNHNCDRVYEKICAKWSVGKLK